MPDLLLLPSYSYIGLIDKISAGIARPAVSAGVELVAARCYATAVLAMGLCLCLSVTSRSSTKTAKNRIT